MELRPAADPSPIMRANSSSSLDSSWNTPQGRLARAEEMLAEQLRGSPSAERGGLEPLMGWDRGGGNGGSPLLGAGNSPSLSGAAAEQLENRHSLSARSAAHFEAAEALSVHKSRLSRPAEETLARTPL